jgi:hypothetical protein
VAPVVSPRGETRAGVRLRRFTGMFELLTQRYDGTPKRQGAGRQLFLHTISLARLTCGVDLLIGYVDLGYGSSFEELADLSQRPDRREMASVRPI